MQRLPEPHPGWLRPDTSRTLAQAALSSRETRLHGVSSMCLSLIWPVTRMGCGVLAPPILGLSRDHGSFVISSVYELEYFDFRPGHAVPFVTVWLLNLVVNPYFPAEECVLGGEMNMRPRKVRSDIGSAYNVLEGIGARCGASLWRGSPATASYLPDPNPPRPTSRRLCVWFGYPRVLGRVQDRGTPEGQRQLTFRPSHPGYSDLKKSVECLPP